MLRFLLAALLCTGASAAPLWLGPSELQGGALDPSLLRPEAVSLQPVFPTIDPEPFVLGVKVLPEEPAPVAADPKWILRIERAVPSINNMGEIGTGDITLIDDNESYCLTLGRYLVRNWGGRPLDASLNGTLCFHPSNDYQDNIFQYILWVNFQWTEFPWNDHLRTKMGLGEGLSYLSHITYSETVKRGGEDSIHLLNYLEFSISLNMADLATLSRLNLLLPGDDAAFLEDAWLVGSLHHRSGGRGLFGDYVDSDGKERPITGGDNLFVLGLAVEF